MVVIIAPRNVIIFNRFKLCYKDKLGRLRKAKNTHLFFLNRILQLFHLFIVKGGCSFDAKLEGDPTLVVGGFIFTKREANTLTLSLRLSPLKHFKSIFCINLAIFFIGLESVFSNENQKYHVLL